MVADQAKRQSVEVPNATEREVSRSRIRDILRMNPPIFTVSNLVVDPQQFIDETHKICKVMRVAETNVVELASDQLNDVAIAWHQMREISKGENAPIVIWEDFSKAFIDNFLPLELREAMVDEFLNLEQRDLSVREYT